MKADINLKNSINTNTHAEDVRAFSDGAAPALQNTGIERDGGVTNLYESQVAYSVAGDHYVTEDGDDLQSVVSGDTRLISVNGRQIGIASAYGVANRLQISGVDDACITATGTYLTATVKGSGIEVCEYSTAQVLLNTRTTTFTNLAAVLQFFTSLSIVRWTPIAYADSLEFALRLGDQIIILKESTPAMAITKSVKGTYVLGAALNILSMVVFGSSLIVAGDTGKLASYDGVSWKYPDGTGGGTGPYNNGSATGNNAITAMNVYYPTIDNIPVLVVAGVGGRLASFRNGMWSPYNTAGVGIWDNATAIGANDIKALISFTANNNYRHLIVAGNGGRLASYNIVTGWTIYTAGAGIRDNGTLIGANNILALGVFHHLAYDIIIVGGVAGRVGSIRVNAVIYTFAVYTTATDPTNPTNNGTVVGASDITAISSFGAADLVFGAATPRIGYLQDGVWFNYNGAGGAGVIINNATAITGAVAALVKIGTGLFVCGADGSIGSWDGAAWKNFDGTGAGTLAYASAILLFFGATVASAVAYNSKVIIGGQLAYVNWIAPNNSHGYLYASAPTVSDLIQGQSDIAYFYMYRYENGAYFSCLTGNTLSRGYVSFYSGAADKWTTTPNNAKYAVLQTSGGKSRHLISGIMNSGVVGWLNHAFSLVGYTDWANFSAARVYPGSAIAITSVLREAYGFGYADVVYKDTGISATDIFDYTLQYKGIPTSSYNIRQINTNTPLDAWGKITNLFGLVPSKPIELRVGLINGVMSFLSAAVLDGIGPDAMGALLTNVGEFDATYTPDFQDDRILYRYNGNFFYIILSKTLTGKVFQKIAEKVYKINTITPLNIISMVDQSLHVGSSDYHGQMIFESTAAPATVATNVASVLAGTITGNPLAEGIFSNSIDVGDKLCYIANPASANISLVGYRIPYGWQSIKEMISTYIADIYSYSTANDGSELVLVDPSNPVYVPDLRLPVAIGLEYSPGTVNTGQQTIFLNPNYDGYTIGNEAKGIYTVFQLYGTTYLFDGTTIYQASMSGDVYTGLSAIAPATGMQYLSSTPTQVYFLSVFDNSVYVFTGGRSLTKFQRMSQLPAILRGVYSTRDNALLLETSTSFIWVRDEIVTQNLKSAAQTSLKLYDTIQGLVIGNDAYTWKYGYNAVGSIVPLIWQSSYFGQTSNQKSNVTAFSARIYSPGKTAQIITGKIDAFDEKAHYSQTVQWDIKKSDYSSGGYYQLRAQPDIQKTLGTSLTLTIPAKTILVDLVAEYADDANAIVVGRATK